MLAESLLERTLAGKATEDANDPGVLGRIGCWVAEGVGSRTLVALLPSPSAHFAASRKYIDVLVEEATALAWIGADSPLEGPAALALLQPQPISDPPLHVRERATAQALAQIDLRRSELDAFAERRAQTLLSDHRRVREAADARGSYSVKAVSPPDLIGLFILLPRVN